MASEGELVIDHRASPGISEGLARSVGLPPQYLGEGKLYETATLWCCHCGVPQIKNPLRTRLRYSCAYCSGKYICDVCAAAAALPSYQHYSFDQLSDMVRSGRFTVSGTSSAPIVTEILPNG